MAVKVVKAEFWDNGKSNIIGRRRYSFRIDTPLLVCIGEYDNYEEAKKQFENNLKNVLTL